MALKFWLGGAKSDKSRRLYKYILDEAEAHPERQYLVIVPEQYCLAAQIELVNGSENCGILNIDVLSFTRFAHRISDETGSDDAVMLDEMGKSLIIGMLALKKKQDLAVFGKNIDKLGYIDKIKTLISEFMQYGISAEKVREMAEAAGDAGRGLLSGKLSDAASLYNDFREYLSDRYTTVEEMLDSVSHLIPSSHTVKNSEIIFDGFTGFTPVQNNLIGVLMEYAINVHIALVLDDCIQENAAEDKIKEHELFYLSKNAMNQLGRIADERKITILDPYKADEYGKNNTKDKIVYKKNITRWKLNNTSVRIFCGRNPDEEVRMTFSRIMELIRNDGYRYRDIAILTGDVEGYRHIIERQLGRHGVPFFIDTAEPMLLNPFIEYIRAFISIVSDNYSIPSVFRCLKTGLAGFSDEETDLLENYCLAAGIKGYKAWHAPFDLHTQSSGDDELLVLNALRERFISKTDFFTGMLGGEAFNAGTVLTVRQMCEALYRLIESDGIEEKLKDAAENFEKTGNSVLSEQYGKIYIRIMDILDELCSLISDEKMDIRGFRKLLDAGLDSITLGILPMGTDFIQVGDLTRSRLSDVKALFIVGAQDGVIPNVSVPAGILNESEREFLTGSDAGTVLAPSVKEEMFAQQLYIYMAINKPSEKLFISWPKISSDGRSAMPSYIIKKIMEADQGIKAEMMPELPDHYTDALEAFEDLTGFIYPASTKTLPADREARAAEMARYFLSDPVYGERLRGILEKELLGRGKDAEDTIGAALAHAIYGRKAVSSITRLESYARCAYRYFLEYGLRLREREIFSFEARDIGTIFHDSMKAYSELVEKRGGNWTQMPSGERDEIMDEAVSAVLKSYLPHKLSSSARNAYMESRIRSIMKKSAETVSSQLKKGRFAPKYFEVDFDSLEDGDALSIRLADDEVMRLRGRIDRVDTCETDDGVYIRVIDYKSSKHDMNLAAVYEGRQLQLLVYLNAAAAIESGRIKREGVMKEVLPAGVFYYRIDDPIIAAKKELSSDEIRGLLMKELRLKGLANRDVSVLELMDEDIAQDPTVVALKVTSSGEVSRASKQAVSGDDFRVLSQYVMNCMSRMGSGIMEGNIAVPEPDGRNRFTGPDCSYCPFGPVCENRGAVKTAEDEEDNDADNEADDRAASKISNDEWIEMMRVKNLGNGQN